MACLLRQSGIRAWTLWRTHRARGSGIARACADFGRCSGSRKAAPGAPDRQRPGNHGCGLRLARHSSPSPMATGRPATLLVVNTLRSGEHETPRAFLERNGLDTGLLKDMPLSLLPEFGVATWGDS